MASVATEKNLKALFEPKSIAVIGASRRKDAVGYAILHNLVQASFEGRIYPINPKADTIEGHKCFKSITEISDPIDLAVLIIPSKFIPKAMQECADKGVKAAIVITAGFREVGGDGKRLEDEMIAIAEKHGIPILGPNCLGLINTASAISMNASFAADTPKKGNIAFLSQSGALGTAVLDYAKGKDIGLSKFISLGNKANTTELDILKYLKDDPHTDVILMYVEDIVDGAAFIEAAREITGELKKPILAIKSGRTLQGAKAASSHTGSLMGSDKVYDAVFEQSGVVRVNSLSEIFDYAIAFASQELPKGNNVAVVTNAGGPGIMATDSCVHFGLNMAELKSETVEELKKYLPATANFSNPIDVIGDAHADRYEKALKYIAADPNVDGLIIILTPQAMTDIEKTAEVIVELNRNTNKTILASFMGLADVAKGIKILEEHKIPHYPFPGEAAKTFSIMVQFKEWIGRSRTEVKEFFVDAPKAAAIIEEAKKEGHKFLTIDKAMEVFEAYGFPILPCGLAKSEAEAVSIAKKVGFPVAMKIVSQEVVHKFDLGGVQLNIKDENEAKATYNAMVKNVKTKLPGAKIDGIFIQAMGEKGREVILGMNRDLHFGPVIMFGLGGIYVEAIKDVTFRLAPMRESSAKQMIRDIRAYPILEGVRGEGPADLEILAECLERLAQVALEHPEISEIDINPLLAFDKGKGAKVIDARIVLE